VRGRMLLSGMALVLFVGACSSSNDAEADGDAQDPVEIPESIGSEGGSVTSDDGRFTIDVPPGALSESTPIRIEVADPATVELDPALLAGEVYRLLPSGTSFAMPVATTRRISAADIGAADNTVPFVYVYHSEDDGWVPLSTEVRRDEDALTVRAEIEHFSENLAIAITPAFGIEEGLRIELTPASFSVPVTTAVETEFIRWPAEGVAAPRPKVKAIATDALVSYELTDAASLRYTATCGSNPGPGEYQLELDGDTMVSDYDEHLDLASAVLAFIGAYPAPDPYTVSVVGQATCTAAEDTDGSDTSGEEPAAATPSGSYGGTLSFEPVTDGTPYDAPFLFSILPAETADVVLTEEAKLAIANLKELGKRIGESATSTVTLSQILANDLGQNTFGTLVTRPDGGTVVITTAVGESYGEIYYGTIGCTDTSPPCQALTVQLLNIGGDSSLTPTQEILTELMRFLDGASETLPGNYQWSSTGIGTLMRETGQGDG
jgi:hypothetical protein